MSSNSQPQSPHAAGVAALKAEYGKARTSDLINRAIRAECYGGDVAIDHMTLLKRYADDEGIRDLDNSDERTAILYRQAVEIVQEMEDGIREQYGLDEREMRDDVARSGGRRRGARGPSRGNGGRPRRQFSADDLLILRDTSLSHREVATRLGVSHALVGRWRQDNL